MFHISLLCGEYNVVVNGEAPRVQSEGLEEIYRFSTETQQECCYSWSSLPSSGWNKNCQLQFLKMTDRLSLPTVQFITVMIFIFYSSVIILCPMFLIVPERVNDQRCCAMPMCIVDKHVNTTAHILLLSLYWREAGIKLSFHWLSVQTERAFSWPGTLVLGVVVCWEGMTIKPVWTLTQTSCIRRRRKGCTHTPSHYPETRNSLSEQWAPTPNTATRPPRLLEGVVRLTNLK